MKDELYAKRKRARELAGGIASRALITPVRVLHMGDDFVRDRVTLRRDCQVKGLPKIAVWESVSEGCLEDYAPEEILDEKEARYAIINLLGNRTWFCRPNLPK